MAVPPKANAAGRRMANDKKKKSSVVVAMLIKVVENTFAGSFSLLAYRKKPVSMP